VGCHDIWPKNAGATYQRTMNLIFHELLGNTVEVYIDDIVVKSVEFSSHIADLRKALDKMRRYGLKMNPRKCAFGVSAGKFLEFVIHEHGIEIDPDRIKSIRNVGPPTCKVEVQKFLGKVNYLRRFISNLAGKIDAFTPILRLKNDAEFAWGAEQQEAFDLIKKYLSLAPILKAPRAGVPFRLYIAAEDKVIGVVLTQETEGKEHVVTYLSRRLVDAETRYTFIEKLCLCLFYACTKCRCYLLSSHCTVSGQADVIKYMLHNPIMSGRIGKWAYALIEYDLAYAPNSLMSDEVYRRTVNDVLLKCLGPDDAILAMAEVHEGICGTHQPAPKMKWLLRRSGFYWPNMIADCFKYYKGCQVCQKFGDLQLVPAAELHPIIKPCPFRGWGLDFIGEIHPSSSKGHRFVLVATDYFTKWTEC
jgi:hypothetical protein